jgi:acetyl esterase/lipase
MVVCPGGSYMSLASHHEGRQVAEWLNTLGVTAFVVQYRLGPRYRHPAPLQDAQRAIRLARAKAAEWAVDPKRVGILGFSAGGHLAATAATHFDSGAADAKDPIDRLGSRPDLAVLVYPVITLTTPAVHSKSLGNLLGMDADLQLRESLSNELQVTPRTPPTFLVHTDEDATVTPENSILFYEALRRAKIPAEVHVFVKGSHGLGLGEKGTAFAAWPDLCAAWMREMKFLGQ